MSQSNSEPIAWHEEFGLGAEYRFVPAAEFVLASPVQPGDKGNLSHARPLPGGYSGQIRFELHAETPVLFGKAVQLDGVKTTIPACLQGKGGETHFVMPAAAIRGMLRSVYRIATFSGLKPIDRNSVFSRRSPDFFNYLIEIGRFGEEEQRKTGERTKPPSKPGWLVIQPNGSGGWDWIIKPISGTTKQVPFKEVAKALLKTEDIEKRIGPEKIEKNRQQYCNPDGSFKDAAFINAWKMRQVQHQNYPLYWRTLSNSLPGFLDGGSYHLSVTGPIEPKQAETLFPEATQGEESHIHLGEEAVARFLLSVSDYKKGGVEFPRGGKRAINNKTFQSAVLAYAHRHGRKAELLKYLGIKPDGANNILGRVTHIPPGIPIHYHDFREHSGANASSGQDRTDDVVFGIPEIFRMSRRYSVGDVADRTQAKLAGELDWEDALFGHVGKDANAEKPRNAALASRLRFRFAKADNAHLMCGSDKAYLVTQGAPKPSFDPFYLSRKNASLSEPKDLATWDSENAVLNGHKRYPACFPLKLQGAPRVLQAKELGKTGSAIQPLASGARFPIVIDFHNLHPLELGALLWSISFGDETVLSADAAKRSRFRHVSGRMRSKGLGRLRPANLVLDHVRRNPLPSELMLGDIENDLPKLALLLMRTFETHIADQLCQSGNQSDNAFLESDQITSLINLADSGLLAEREALVRLAHYPIKPDGISPDFTKFTGMLEALYRTKAADGKSEKVHGQRRAWFTREGQKTVLAEFLKPVGKAPATMPASREVKDLSAKALIDPVSALGQWQQQRR